MYMLGIMFKIFCFTVLLFLRTLVSYAEDVKSIVIKGNERITKETIIVFSNVNINDNLNANDLNEITKNLYSTDFFSDVSIKLEKIFSNRVKENYLVQNINKWSKK